MEFNSNWDGKRRVGIARQVYLILLAFLFFTEISIFDLLDDDDDRPNDAEQTPVNAQESHVAFSVEGSTF